MSVAVPRREPSWEDFPPLRVTVMAVACGLAFGSGVAVVASYLIDRLRGR